MHEYSIAYDLYATAKKAALDHRATQVKKISVDVGKMAMVNPEQVIFLFDTIKEDDPLFTATVLDCTEVEPADEMPLRVCRETRSISVPAAGHYRKWSGAVRLS